MTVKELRKVDCGELLGILAAQSKKIEALEARLDRVAQQLRGRRPTAKRSAPNAPHRVNHVFSTAEAVGKHYLEDLQVLYAKERAICSLQTCGALSVKNPGELAYEMDHHFDHNDPENLRAEALRNGDLDWMLTLDR
jgi:hypothetical protein